MPDIERSSALCPEYEGTSLLGTDLCRNESSLSDLSKLEFDLASAKVEYDANPSDEQAAIWYGRRLGYLRRFREAIRVYTDALEVHPNSAELLRHRGHRYITLRNFKKAVADLSRAAELIDRQPDEVEPDGQPNEKNIPLSTLHSNIWYHLGLAHYLKGNYEQALAAYQHRVDLAANDDQLVSTTYWRYLCLKHLGRYAEAAALVDPAVITDTLNVIENESYYAALRTVRGLEHPRVKIITPLTAGVSVPATEYAVAVYELTAGRERSARDGFDRVRELSDWPNFVHIAAEAELARMQTKR